MPPITVPTADDAEALYAFIMERADDEHAATMDDETLTPDAMARFCRVSNAHKLGITGLTAYIVALGGQGDMEQAALAWGHLTAAGEEWRDHPDYLPGWENAERAEIRNLL